MNFLIIGCSMKTLPITFYNTKETINTRLFKPFKKFHINLRSNTFT